MYTCPMHPEVQKDTPGICPEAIAEEVGEQHLGALQEIISEKYGL